MFVLSQSQSYSWPVEVEFPVSGGKFEKQTFDAEFKRIPQTRIRELKKSIIDGTLESDTVLANELLLGWKGITDAKGGEVPFSESAREQLLDVPHVAGSVVKAWLDSISGAKTKN